MKLQHTYLRIAPEKYHFLKFILEGYDGLCLLSSVPEYEGCVRIGFPEALGKDLFGLLDSIAKAISPFPQQGLKAIPMDSQSFLIKTFGCQMNDRDSEIMAQLLGEQGYIETREMAQADLILLNTCSIRAKAEQKVMSLLGVLRKYKKQNPKLIIGVAGCVAQQEGEEIIKRMPHVDLVIGTQNIYQLPELLNDLHKGTVATTLADDYQIPSFIPDLTSAARTQSPIIYKKFLTIMQGCNNFCSYCVVPYTRGREVSRKVSDILDEVRVLVEGGVKEITLLGQNVNSYGQTNSVTEDGSDYMFADLLHAVAAIPGLERLRFTTSNPKDLSDELMRCFQEIDILCKQFHLPVQSGSNAILSRMNRKYTREHYLELVTTLRSYCPDIAITTDMIIGFPGESEKDFTETMDLQERVRFHGSYSFKYSDRPGTRSSEFKDKIPEPLQSERLAIFQKRQDEISLEYNKEYVGTVLPVMIEKTSKESVVSRSESNHLVHIKQPAIHYRPGDIVPVKIVHAGLHSLNGEPYQ